MSSVVLGTDVETGQEVCIGDIERRSGLYLLGRPGMGKSALAVNIALQDIANWHDLFFLDPHGDAVVDLLRRMECSKVIGGNLWHTTAFLFDPEDEEYSFGINLLACDNVASLKARTDTYTRAYNVFYKLWEDSWGPWLQLILQNVLWAFIENQDYTLADVPMFLNPRNTEFREHIISNIQYNSAVADFWRYEFFSRREQNQQERVDAALTRLNTLLTHPYVRHIIGQQKKTLDFIKLLTLPFKLAPDIWLFRLSANLAEDIKKFIGTILISELLHAVRARPEDNRPHVSIFIDEFHNFATSEDMGTLVTEGRKFGVAATFAHVERFGQLANNQKLMGATQATVNKVLFQTTVNDAEELALEFAQEPPTEFKRERQLVISQEPVKDLLLGHPNLQIQEFVNRYLRPMQFALEDTREDMEAERLLRQALMDEVALSRFEAGNSRWLTATALAGAAASTEQTLAQVQYHSANLISLLARIRNLRASIRSINLYFTSIMEGQIVPEPGHELFSHFLLTFVPKAVALAPSNEQAFTLYISLHYGSPHLPRSIPVALAAKYQLIQREEIFKKLEAIQTQKLLSSYEQSFRDTEKKEGLSSKRIKMQC
jgi:hypothetical protein